MYKGFGCSLVFLPTDMIQQADSHQGPSDNRNSTHCVSTEHRHIMSRHIRGISHILHINNSLTLVMSPFLFFKGRDTLNRYQQRKAGCRVGSCRPCRGQRAGLENNARITAVGHPREGEYHSLPTGGSSLNLLSKKRNQKTQDSGYTNCCWEKTVMVNIFRTNPADVWSDTKAANGYDGPRSPGQTRAAFPFFFCLSSHLLNYAFSWTATL